MTALDALALAACILQPLLAGLIGALLAALAIALKRYNFELRGITILYQNRKRVFPYGYPYAFVPNIHHQYMMILQNAKD